MPVPPYLARIGPYQVSEELGRGSFGAVYLARDPNGEQVALKLFSRSEGAASALERFRREPKALARTLHPNVVRVRDAGEHAGLPFFVMDLVRGSALEDLLAERGPLAW